MDNDVAGIDQHPVAVLLAFDADAFQAGLVEALNSAVRDRCDMAVRASAGHNHGIGDRGLAGEIDGDGVLAFISSRRAEDQAKGLLSVRTLGDGFGHTTGFGPRAAMGSGASFPFGCRPRPESPEPGRLR